MSGYSGSLSYSSTNWDAIVLQASSNPALAARIVQMDRYATAMLNAPLTDFVRPTEFAAISPAMLSAAAAGAGVNKESFALAMADCYQCDQLRTKGVYLAVAAKVTGNTQYEARCIEILRTVVGYKPLQRPGWSTYTPDAVLPAGGDGVWLATSWGISGIVEMLTVLGDKVPTDLRSELRAMIYEEVRAITTDWEQKRPWYVRVRATESNQWIEPTIGLLQACEFLSDPQLMPAYDLGVENLVAALSSLGSDGACLEGLSYAQMTMGRVFEALGNLKANGDLRCQDLPFVRNHWKWLLSMHLPGGYLVNTYDSKLSQLPAWAVKTPLSALVQAARASSDNSAIPTIKHLFPEGDSSINGILYESMIGNTTACAPAEELNYMYFPSQQQLVWRSCMQAPQDLQTAFAVVVRGGSARDGHAHRDQGQVDIYCGKRVILMDCGTPEYSHPDYESKFARAAGHGVMQINELFKHSTPVSAPIRVDQLNSYGGLVMVDTTAAYSGVTMCERTVQWSIDGDVQFKDQVQLVAPAAAGTEFYRFHTGSTATLNIAGNGRLWTVSWPGVTMMVESDTEIMVTQSSWPDRTCTPYMHQALMISAVGATQQMSISTRVVVDLALSQ